MADIKISELEPTTDLEGLYTIGSDKNNLSKKVSLQFLKDAANYANEQGDYAKQAGDTVNGNVGVSDYPEFSASQSYVIGDIVRYNGVLYAFTANHAASAWNGSDVKATSINAITSGKLTELESKTSGFPFIGYIDNESINPKSYVKWKGQDCFFVATQGGTYKEFGNTKVLDGELAFIIYYDGTWIKQTIVPTTNKGFQFVGIVNNFTTKPATQFPLWDDNNNNFVLATEPGTYEHCGGLVCEEGEIAVFVTLNGTWHKLNSKIAKRGQSSEDARFIGKKMAILGDSISTYQGYIPSNYQYFYPTSSCPDVNSVSKTYWKIVADNLGLSVKNCAYSGSTCAETGGYGVVGCSDERIAELGKDGNPDIVWVYIGINDWGYGKVDLGDWTPEKALPTNGDTFSNAYALMLSKIQIAYPDAKIFCSPLLPDKARDADHNFPLVNSRNITLKAFNDKIVEIANGLGVNVVNMPGCGINWNTMQYYFGDYSETYGIHPNAAGHKKMAAQLLAALKAMY